MWLIKNKRVRVVTVKVGHLFLNFLTNHIDSTDELNNNSNHNQQYEFYRSLVDDYNDNMKKVDQFNQTYYYHLPIIRQHNALTGIRRALLRFAVVNAYRMYELFHQKQLRQDDFLEMLMYELIGFTQKGWIDFKGHLFLHTPKEKRCELCVNRKNASRCNHWCVKCLKSMCKKCYLKFHIK